jgi:hypothetical protein
MPLYIFVFHSGGLPLDRVEQEFSTEAEALAAARILSSRYGIDVWLGDEVVATMSKRIDDRRADAGMPVGKAQCEDTAATRVLANKPA